MMPPDFPLHLIFLLSLFALGVVRVWYWRRQRSLLGHVFAAQQRVFADARQIGATVGFVTVTLHLIRPQLLGWTEFPLHVGVRWGGAVLTLIAIGLCTMAARDEIKALDDTRRNTFVARGLFRRVRHPIEDGLVVLAVALTLLSADWVVAVLAGGLALHGLFVRAPRVERQRRGSAGEAYESYAMTTPAFFPRWRA